MKRQFINLVHKSCWSGCFTLRRIKSSSLFHQNKRGGRSTVAVEKAELPEPALSFGPCVPRHHRSDDESGGIIFAPFGFNRDKIVNADQKGNVVVLDTCENNVSGMPRLKGCMANSIPINMGDALYIIKRCPEKPYGPNQACFQALIHGKPPEDVDESSPGWHWHSLPPPPYVEAPGYKPSCDSEISSAVVVHKSIWVSATGIGTYRFDTTYRDWSEIGSWELPFRGGAQYVCELDSWLGFSPEREDQFLCAWYLRRFNDDHAPVLCRVWSEREDLAIPEDWELLSSHLVRVDYGRFCIARSFHVYEDLDGCGSIKERFMVLTCVEVGNSSEADGRVRMVKHRSVRYTFDVHAPHWVF